jgi:hypothetical protein
MLHWVRGQGRRVSGPVVAPLMGCVLAFGLMGAARAAVQTIPVDLGVANAAAPAFSPDGRTAYVGRRKGTDGAGIVRLMRQGDGWGAAVPASFSERSHRDLEPVFAPSGRYLIFASNRAAIPGQSDFDGHFNAIRAHHRAKLMKPAVSCGKLI